MNQPQYDYNQQYSQTAATASATATTGDSTNSTYYEQGGYYDASGQWVAYDYSYYQNYDQNSATQSKAYSGM